MAQSFIQCTFFLWLTVWLIVHESRCQTHCFRGVRFSQLLALCACRRMQSTGPRLRERENLPRRGMNVMPRPKLDKPEQSRTHSNILITSNHDDKVEYLADILITSNHDDKVEYLANIFKSSSTIWTLLEPSLCCTS